LVKYYEMLRLLMNLAPSKIPSILLPLLGFLLKKSVRG